MANTSKADLLLVGVTLLAGISWMLSKEAVLLMPPLFFMALRFTLAGLILASAGWRQLSRLGADQYRRGLTVGVVFGVGMSLWVMGLHFSDHLGEGAFLASLGVVLVPVMARLVFKETPPVTTWVALPVAASGLALLSLDGSFRAEPGQLFFIGSACVYALYFTLNTRAANSLSTTAASGHVATREKVPALALTTLTLFCVGAVTAGGSLLLEDWRAATVGFTPEMAGWVAASAVVGTAGRFFVQTYAQSLSTHSHGVVIMVLEPMWTALFAALWFDERMSGIQMGGCLMIFLALVVNRWASVRRVLKGWLG